MRLHLLRQGFPDRPAFGTAVSMAILQRVAAGELPATLRLHRPARELAFSKHDAASPGFEAAVEAARGLGFQPVLRLAGGRAAAFTEGTLAIAWSTPDPWPARRTQERFASTAEIVAAALCRLGVEARIGEVPGEYCPGAWSVGARGRVKIAGLGQRMIRGAAHVGGVVVATGAEPLREALEHVYEALGLEWVPATAGSAADEVPGIGPSELEEALLTELAERHELVEWELDAGTLALAERLQDGHAIDL